MGSSPPFFEVFAAEPAAATGVSFARFMALALYHPEVGYYRKDATRVGRDPQADFYTATSLGPIFGELVSAAAVELLGPERNVADHTFVEIGAEPAGGVLANVAHPFAAEKTLRVGETLALAGKLVVFSNELFDAQPFRRFVFRDGAWRELGVALAGGSLREVELSAARNAAAELPESAPEGYRLDLPEASRTLLDELVGQPWSGLFLAFDYGKSWQELVEATPQGTARAYFHHRQSNDLLARPGEQDLTGHVCWDWLETGLQKGGFSRIALESQEGFLTRHAGSALASIVSAEAARFSPRKQAILQLLQAAHLGRKFQVLSGLR